MTATLLLLSPEPLIDLFLGPLVEMVPPHLRVVVQGRDQYDVPAIDYFLSFRPPKGFVASLPNLKSATNVVTQSSSSAIASGVP